MSYETFKDIGRGNTGRGKEKERKGRIKKCLTIERERIQEEKRE